MCVCVWLRACVYYYIADESIYLLCGGEKYPCKQHGKANQYMYWKGYWNRGRGGDWCAHYCHWPRHGGVIGFTDCL